MDNTTLSTLLKRNNDIINILLENVKDYSGWVDLIAVTGSFVTGGYHEKSDLDIFLVINDEKAKELNRCFILGDVGFDIYSVDMNHLNDTAGYRTPHLSKLLSSEIIYSSPEGLRQFNLLRDKAQNLLSDEKFYSDIISEHLGVMLTAYEEMKCTEDKYSLYMALGKFIVFCEYVLYTLNRKFITGVKAIAREISEMKYLPDGFTDKYTSLPSLTSKEEIIIACGDIADSLCGYLIKINAVKELPAVKSIPSGENPAKTIPTKENFRGVYEEFISNYKHKLHLASKTQDIYYSFINTVYSQLFLDEIYNFFDIPRIDLISSYDPTDLNANAVNFDEAAKKILTVYEKIGLKVNYYSDTEELKKLYK